MLSTKVMCPECCMSGRRKTALSRLLRLKQCAGKSTKSPTQFASKFAERDVELPVEHSASRSLQPSNPNLGLSIVRAEPELSSLGEQFSTLCMDLPLPLSSSPRVDSRQPSGNTHSIRIGRMGSNNLHNPSQNP